MARFGADAQNRTGGLIHTKDMLCRLSYISAVRKVSEVPLCLALELNLPDMCYPGSDDLIGPARSTYSERSFCLVVEGDGFEPSKAEPADLQSAPFGHSGIPPNMAMSFYQSVS